MMGKILGGTQMGFLNQISNTGKPDITNKDRLNLAAGYVLIRN